MATSTDCEDLTYNPFYNVLRNNYSKIFTHAQEKNYLICVPMIACLSGIKLTQTFIESHLLKPSPYLKLMYSPMNKPNTFITLHNRDLYIEEQINSSDVKKTSVHIIADERGYTKHFKEYTICVIDEPLILVQRYESQKKKPCNNPQLGNTYSSYCKYLMSFNKSADLTPKIKQEVDIFNNSYIIVQGYLDETCKKLELLCSNYSQLFLNSLSSDYDGDQRVSEWIPVAVESFIMYAVHDKVYQAVCESERNTDEQLGEIIKKSKSLTVEDLGVSTDFCCPFTAAIVELARIEGLKTPIERLLCYRETLKQIYNDVEAHVNKQQPLKCVFDEPVSVTADDLIPMLVFVLLQSKCLHLMANQYYLEHFNWSNTVSDDLSYTLVTFSAALHYILSEKFIKLVETNRHKFQNEISVGELAATLEHNKIVDDRKDCHNISPTERQFNEKLENISEALVHHCAELPEEPCKSSYRRFSNQSTSRVKKRQGKEDADDDLGSFLSGLSSDFLDVSYGQQ